MKAIFTLLLSVFLVSLLSFGCKKDVTQQSKDLSFKTETYEKKTGDCPDETERCLTIKLTYPIAEGGVDSIRQKFNDHINRSNLSLLTFGENELDLSLTIDSAVLELGEEYLDFLDDTEFAQAWFLESEGTIAYIDSNYISFNFSQSTYMGGAHPNSNQQKTVFDIKTGKQLTLNELVKDLPGLRAAAETAFRKVRKIPEGQSFTEAGFWFEEDEEFLFAHNFGLSENGLEFFYNPYEIAPYAVGPTSVLIKNWQRFK